MQDKDNNSPATTLRDLALERVTWSRKFVNKLLVDIKDDHLLTRVGGVGNHPMWVMGHLATVDDNVVSALTGEPRRLPERFQGLFFMGSEPSERAADYPSRREVVDAMAASRERMTQWIASLDDTTAFEPTPGPLQGFAPNRVRMALEMAPHEMLHAGQLTVVRAALGLPRLIQ